MQVPTFLLLSPHLSPATLLAQQQAKEATGTRQSQPLGHKAGWRDREQVGR